jgi:hypothetical protein
MQQYQNIFKIIAQNANIDEMTADKFFALISQAGENEMKRIIDFLELNPSYFKQICYFVFKKQEAMKRKNLDDFNKVIEEEIEWLKEIRDLELGTDFSKVES